MENRVKTRLSRIFQGSLSSCKTKNLLDVVEDAVLIPQNHQNDQPLKPSPVPFLCKPRHFRNENAKPINGVTNSIVPRRKLYSFLAEEGFKCPPPASPLVHFLNPFYSSLPKEETNKKISKKKETKKKKKKVAAKQERKRSQDASQLFRSYSQDSAYYYNWFSSEEEEDEEEENDSVFFSSRSNTISSDSSGFNVAPSKRHRPKKGRRRRRLASTPSFSSGSSSRSSHKGKDVNVMPLVGDLDPADRSSVKDSFPVVKTSSDPHSDFRTSMVEMIIEKQIFGAEELERLLRCFLSLNSDHHHGIILQVFDEICEALFSG